MKNPPPTFPSVTAPAATSGAGPGEVPVGQRLSVQHLVYVWLACFFVACLLIADIVGVRLFSVKIAWLTVEHTCGMITFPVTFLLTDLINEYYGKRGARRITFIAFGMGVFAFAIINVARALPRLEQPFNVDEKAFEAVFAGAQVMFAASLVAFLVGQYADIAVFGLLKRLTKGKLLWLRATGSTVVSQLIDSFVVTTLAFNVGRTLFGGGPAVPMFEGESTILKIAVTGYLLKFFIAIAITPLIYLGHGVMKRWFGLVPVAPEQ